MPMLDPVAVVPAPSTELAAIAAAVSDAIVTADQHGTITSWLGGAEAIFGWSAEEAVGRPLHELIVPPDLREAHSARFRAVARGAESKLIGRGPIEVPALRRDGTRFPCELTLGRGDGETPFLVGVLRDVTGRRQTEATLRIAQDRFSGIFDAAPIGMTLSTIDGSYVRANDAFCRLVGRSEAELQATTFIELTHPDDRARDRELASQLLTGDLPRARVDKRYLRPDGSSVLVEAIVVVVCDPDGDPLHYLTQVRDVEAERQALAALERSNRELEELASVASHDLRAPLAVVGGFLELLRTRHGDALGPEGRTFVDHAASAAEGMRDLLDSMLRLARHDAHVELALGPVDLRDVVVQALASVTGDARVAIERLPVVRGDADLLRQVVQNLLGNAMRHADAEDPQVRVSATPLDDAWCVSISDNGPGVPEADRSRVFDRFSRGDGGGAAGLGLAICKRAVERLGGRIWIDEAPGGGADVRFTLPR
jgi:PAS domain S-box-containing protein